MNALLLIFPVLLGYFLGRHLLSGKPKMIKLLLSFSGAYLLGISFLHLLPEAYGHGHNHGIGLWILAGFLVQVLLEVFSKGMEHGHRHHGNFKDGLLPVSALASLYLHAFFESLPIGAGHAQSGEVLTFAIMLHKLPVSIVLYLFLKELKLPEGRLIAGMLLFAAAAPLGSLVGEVWPDLRLYYKEITAFTVGIFLHISTTILFESSQGHRFNRIKFVTILVGFAAAWLGSH